MKLRNQSCQLILGHYNYHIKTKKQGLISRKTAYISLYSVYISLLFQKETFALEIKVVTVWSNDNRYYNYGVVIKLRKQRKNGSNM